MAQLTIQSIVRSGLNPSMSAAAAGGDQFANTVGRTFLLVDNRGSGTVVVTIDIQKTYAGQAVVDPTVSIALGQPPRMIGPFDKAWEDSSGNVQFTYDTVTDVDVAAVKL